jgi:hypothetical protein
MHVSGGWGFQISRQLAHEGSTVVSPMHRPPLPPHKIFLVLISVRGWVDPMAIVRPERLCQWKIPMTPSGIEPTTFQLVVQCHNQLHHHGAACFQVKFESVRHTPPPPPKKCGVLHTSLQYSIKPTVKNNLPLTVLFSMVQQSLVDRGLLLGGFTITLRHATLGRALWTSDQSNPETSTWQHTTLTQDRHPCPLQDSNPQSQQVHGQWDWPW